MYTLLYYIYTVYNVLNSALLYCTVGGGSSTATSTAARPRPALCPHVLWRHEATTQCGAQHCGGCAGHLLRR